MEFLFEFLGSLFANVIENRKVRIWIKLVLLILLALVLLFIIGQAIYWSIAEGSSLLSVIILGIFAAGIASLLGILIGNLVRQKNEKESL